MTAEMPTEQNQILGESNGTEFTEMCGPSSCGARHSSQQQHARRVRVPFVVLMMQFAVLLVVVPFALSSAAPSVKPTRTPSVKPTVKPTVTPTVKPTVVPSTIRPTVVPTAGYATSHIAGNGTAGFSGDGGPAKLAQLYSPRGVAVDSSKNLYISDHMIGRIRMVNPSGIISTFAGGGTSLGNFIAATSAQLDGVKGISLQPFSIDLFVSHAGAHRVVAVRTVSGMVRTVMQSAGCFMSGVAEFAATAAPLLFPNKLYADHDNNVFVTSTCGASVLKLSMSSNRGSVFLGGTQNTAENYATSGLSFTPKAATSVQLYTPHGIWGDSTGNLYVGELSYKTVLRVSVADKTVMTYLGKSAPFFQGPTFSMSVMDMVGHDGMLYMCGDGSGSKIYKADTNAQQLSLLYAPGVTTNGIGLDADNNILLVLDSNYVDLMHITTPTALPTLGPSKPTTQPSLTPTINPTAAPTTREPTITPTLTPTTASPSTVPSVVPSVAPTVVTVPSPGPTVTPSLAPILTTVAPTKTCTSGVDGAWTCPNLKTRVTTTVTTTTVTVAETFYGDGEEQE